LTLVEEIKSKEENYLFKKPIVTLIPILFILSFINSSVIGYEAKYRYGENPLNVPREHRALTHPEKDSSRTSVTENIDRNPPENEVTHIANCFIYPKRSFNPNSSPENIHNDEGSRVQIILSENFTVQGYILDNTTGEPIKNASVTLYRLNHQDIVVNSTHSDSKGFYSMNFTETNVHLVARANGYFSGYEPISPILDNDTLWVNFSLVPGAPAENSSINGYIRDNVTGNFIKNAAVLIRWRDAQEYLDWNHTYTNDSGYYDIHVAEGTTTLDVFASGYFRYTGEYVVGENETLVVNVSLYPHPVENSVVCGYVTDNETGDPIKGVFVNLSWRDNEHRLYNGTSTGVNGFYSMCVAAGVINLRFEVGGYIEYTGEYVVGENETLVVNVSLYPRPVENSVVCGYVTDNETGDPIAGVFVNLTWVDEYVLFNSTSTGVDGFYSMCVAAGSIDLCFEAKGYFKHVEERVVGNYETVAVDVRLSPHPVENSVVCGYVTDNETGDPINGVFVNLSWRDDEHRLYNGTSTGVNGFYSMCVAAGSIDLSFEAKGYFKYDTEIYTVAENDTLVVNVSLSPYPPENSVVCGYVTDNETGDPINGVFVNLSWRDDEHRLYNSTSTNVNGFYRMRVAAGTVNLRFEANGYFKHAEERVVGNYQTVAVDVRLCPYPPENSTVYGHVTNNITDAPIRGAYVNLTWSDNGHTLYNSTLTNVDGSYSIHIAAGAINLRFDAKGYHGREKNVVVRKNERKKISISLDPILPPQNSTVYGRITDIDTGDPIENVNVELRWEYKRGYYVYNSTTTDAAGQYRINVAAGKIGLKAQVEGYLPEETDIMEIQGNQVLEVNFSLASYHENSVVYGYVTDADTNLGIKGAQVELTWYGRHGHTLSNSTRTNSTGFYSICVAAGKIRLFFDADNYLSYTDKRYIGDDEELRIDVSLHNDTVEVEIVKPKKALYIRGRETIRYPFGKPVIVGAIDVVVKASYATKRVEFYINNIQEIDSNKPFVYSWDEFAFGRYTIRVKASGGEYNEKTDTAEIEVWKFF
jgi:5-hydroxyisourate hydrolase-like protein (transthyretin family)